MLLDVVFPYRLVRLKNNFVWLVDSWKINQFNLLRLSVALGETGTQASIDCIGTCRAAATPKTSACGRCVAKVTGWRIKCKGSDQRRYVTRINLDGKNVILHITNKSEGHLDEKFVFLRVLNGMCWLFTMLTLPLYGILCNKKRETVSGYTGDVCAFIQITFKMFFCFVVVFEERYNSNCLNTQDNSLN